MKNKEIIRDISVIYIGPTIKKYGLNSGNIFIGSLSINIQETLKKFPILKELFVPINEDFPIVKKNLKSRRNKRKYFI